MPGVVRLRRSLRGAWPLIRPELDFARGPHLVPLVGGRSFIPFGSVSPLRSGRSRRRDRGIINYLKAVYKFYLWVSFYIRLMRWEG